MQSNLLYWISTCMGVPGPWALGQCEDEMDISHTQSQRGETWDYGGCKLVPVK